MSEHAASASAKHRAVVIYPVGRRFQNIHYLCEGKIRADLEDFNLHGIAYRRHGYKNSQTVIAADAAAVKRDIIYLQNDDIVFFKHRIAP